MPSDHLSCKDMAESDIASSAEFSPSAFYDELSSSINQQIDSQIESFQKELLAVSLSLCGSEIKTHLIDEINFNFRSRKKEEIRS